MRSPTRLEGMETFYDAKQKYEAALSPTRLEGMETPNISANGWTSLKSPTRLEGMETSQSRQAFHHDD